MSKHNVPGNMRVHGSLDGLYCTGPATRSIEILWRSGVSQRAAVGNVEMLIASQRCRICLIGTVADGGPRCGSKGRELLYYYSLGL
jgi:hypothetical protein